MNTKFEFVCDPSEMKITVNIAGNNTVAHLALHNKDDIILSRKFIIKSTDSEEINEAVSIFCDLAIQGKLREKRFVGEEQDAEFIVSSCIATLKKVYSKLGLPVWEKDFH